MQFNNSVTRSVSEAVKKVMEESKEGTHPKTEKEKELAAMAHPKDKITHKDVLVGRGVLKKEEKESCEDGAEEAVDKHEKKMHGKKGEVSKHEKEMHNEESDLEEGTKMQVAPGRTRNTGTYGQAKGSEFGGTDWDKEESGKDEKPKRAKYGARQNYKRSTRVNESFTQMLSLYEQKGLKALAEMTTLKEEVGINEESTYKLGRASAETKDFPIKHKGEHVGTLQFHTSGGKLYHRASSVIGVPHEKFLTHPEHDNMINSHVKKHESEARQHFAKKLKEEVDYLDEDTMTHITLGKKVKNTEGGHSQDVHHKGKKIGSIDSYKHRGEMRYGAHHDASGESTVGSRTAEGAIADLRFHHAEHLKSMKEEVDSEEFEKEMKDQKNKFDGKKKGADVAKASVQAVKVEEDVEHLEEMIHPGYMIDHPEHGRGMVTSVSSNQEGWPKTPASEHERTNRNITVQYGSGKNAKEVDHKQHDIYRFIDKKTRNTAKKRFANSDRYAKTYTEEVEQIEERELTDAEMKKKEDYVMSMKKGLKGFKDRYGDRAKEVMYATATKMAKKED